MKKIGLFTFFILIFLSCTKDEKPIPEPEPLTYEPNLLLRGWSYETVLWNGTLYLYDHNPDCYSDFFGFRNNEGQQYQFEETYFTNTYCSGNTTVLRWEPIGNHINFYFGTPKVDEYEVLTLTDKLFTFGFDRDIDKDGKKEHLIVNAIPYDPYHSYGVTKIKNNTKLKLFPVKLHLNKS